MSGGQFNNVDFRSFINKTAASATAQLITTNTVANPTVITVAGHGLIDQREVVIAGNTTSTPTINGTFVATVIDEDTFSIEVNVTVGGASDGTMTSESGTIGQPKHVTYYSTPRFVISSITLASPAIITSVSNHNLVTGDYIYVIDSTSTPTINGGRIVTVTSATTFSVGVDTSIAGTSGVFFLDKFSVKDLFIDGYLGNGDPIYLGNTLRNSRYSLGESRFETSVSTLQRGASVIAIQALDPRFSITNDTGHRTDLDDVLSDVNESGNDNWLTPSVATTLSVVSTSPDDFVAGGSGLQVLLIQGLDGSFDPILELVFLFGTTPVITSLSFRAVSLIIAVAGGTPGSGAAGRIDVSSTTDSTVWATAIINSSSMELGRITIPNTIRYGFRATMQNGGVDADMTVNVTVEPLGGFPFSIGEGYIGGGTIDVVNLNSFTYLDAGTTIRWRAFTNSGSPTQRKINCTFFGTFATEEAWDSLIIE
jgi:hypothetical protein